MTRVSRQALGVRPDKAICRRALSCLPRVNVISSRHALGHLLNFSGARSRCSVARTHAVETTPGQATCRIHASAFHSIFRRSHSNGSPWELPAGELGLTATRESTWDLVLVLTCFARLLSAVCGTVIFAGLHWMNFRRMGRLLDKLPARVRAMATRILPQSAPERMPFLGARNHGWLLRGVFVSRIRDGCVCARWIPDLGLGRGIVHPVRRGSPLSRTWRIDWDWDSQGCCSAPFAHSPEASCQWSPGMPRSTLSPESPDHAISLIIRCYDDVISFILLLRGS